jgi:hypothetical protein
MNLQEWFETGLVIIGLVLFIVFTSFIWSIFPKILGFLFLLFGFFTLRYFPRMTKYQPLQFQRAGMLISFLCILVGIIIIGIF